MAVNSVEVDLKTVDGNRNEAAVDEIDGADSVAPQAQTLTVEAE